MNSLIKAFDISSKNSFNYSNDYDIFTDKELLEKLRKQIIDSIINSECEGEISKEFINNKIDIIINGYDFSNTERSYLFNVVNDELNGYGPITSLLEDDKISEILINSSSEIFIELDGKHIFDPSISFIDDDHILRTITKLASSVDKKIDFNNSFNEFRLKNNTRVTILTSPIVDHPVVTIKKYNNDYINVVELIRVGTLTADMATFLEAAVLAKMNIIISGNFDSGKSSLLNTFISFIPENDRMVVIEKNKELIINHKNAIILESQGSRSFNELVSYALRMSPTRLVLGEINKEESYDVLNLLSNGYHGFMASIYSDTPEEVLGKIETMVSSTNPAMPIKNIREYLMDSIDLIVTIEKTSDGKRRITNISEVLDLIDNRFVIKNIFSYTNRGILANGSVDGEFVMHNYIPDTYKKIKSRGVNTIDQMFSIFVVSDKDIKPLLKKNDI